MRAGSRNTQMFAHARPPAAEVVVADAAYRLVCVFKHDFFAATSLYEATGGSARPAAMRIVVKEYRTQPFCGLGMDWLGRLSRDHEKAIYAALAGVEGVPRWVGDVGATGCAIEYVEAAPLDHGTAPPGWFDRMRELFDAIHARGVAYLDANKRSNMLVTPDGRPFLIDYQIAIRRRDDWPRPLRNVVARIVRYCQRKDIYHLYKHKRRLAPEELTDREERLSHPPAGGWLGLHRALTTHWRVVRRRWLCDQYRAGRLVSPSADLEDHRQPEKQTWRKD